MKFSIICALLSLALAAQLAGCGAVPTETSPGVVPDELPVATSSAAQQAANLEALEGSERTEKGVYYKLLNLIAPPEPLPEPLPGELDAAAAADLCQSYAETMGLSTEGLVWKLRRASYDPIFAPVIWDASLTLPPIISDHPLNYTGTIEELNNREVSCYLSVWLNSQTGELIRYWNGTPDPYTYETHTAEEYAAHTQAEADWKASEEYRQTLMAGCADMGLGTVKELVLLNPERADSSDYLAVLENGDCWFINAAFHSKKLNYLEFSTYYFDGEVRK